MKLMNERTRAERKQPAQRRVDDPSLPTLEELRERVKPALLKLSKHATRAEVADIVQRAQLDILQGRLNGQEFCQRIEDEATRYEVSNGT